MISSPGIGSGLDVNSIVSQLMAVERQPVNRLETQKSTYKSQLSAYGQLKSAVSSFRDAMAKLDSPSDFRLFTATSANEDYFTATAGSTAAAGSYNIEVVRIAERHRMAAGDANTYAATDTDIGAAGTMSITVGSEPAFSVNLAGQSLAGIRDAINNASDNPGVTASIINDDVGNRLVLTANDTGSSNALSVSYSGSDPFALQTLNTDRDGSGGYTSADLDAVLVLEGQFTVTRSSNTIDDAIDGITLDVKAAGTAGLTVARDTGGITKQAQAFVDAYNNLKSTIETLRGGTLEAENTLLSIDRQLRTEFNTVPTGLSGQFSYLSEVGVSFQKDGKLALDSDTLKTALDNDFDGVAQLFANDDQGYAFRVRSLADTMLQTNGLIDARRDGINDSISSIDTRIDMLNRRLDITESRYRAQFSALDGLVAGLTKTGNFLTQQLAALPFASNRR